MEGFQEKRKVAAASMEGNVRVPQNALGIAVLTAEQCLRSPEPAKALEALIAPIPYDTHLAERTRKANAQHNFHDIRVPLSADDVRRVELQGNIETLNLIAKTLGMRVSLSHEDEETDEETGEWATNSVRERVVELQNLLTPRTTESLRALFLAGARVLTAPDVKEKLRARKEAYRESGASPESAEEKGKRKAAARLMNEVIQAVLEAIHEEGEKGSMEKKRMAMNLMATLRTYAPVF